MSEQIDDGGSVTANLMCQRHVSENVIAEEKVVSVGGLSVRDYFAAAALQGYCARQDLDLLRMEAFADSAYRQSDAMIAARKEGTPS
jgi:hypothetical protein